MTIANRVTGNWRAERARAGRPRVLRAGIFAVCPLLGCACMYGAGGAGGLVMRASPRRSAAAASRGDGPALREIFDPCLGLHWQLRIDARHPEGPRRMVLLNPGRDAGFAVQASPASGAAAANPVGEPSAIPSVPIQAPVTVIRAGDRVVVDQETARVHARLEARALEPAGVGQMLRVRLGVGRVPDLSAPVISVVAEGAGAARWLAGSERGR